MWIFKLLTLGICIGLGLHSFGQSGGRPVCVQINDATALVSLTVKSPSRKVAGKKKSSKRESPLKIKKYTPLNWTGKREGRWLQVRNMSGQTYWMRGRDLSSSIKCLAVRVEQSRMYKGPGSSFDKAEVAKKGEVFMDMGGEDGYTQVEDANGKRAWINLDHTWKPLSRIRMTFSPDK